jgi:CheY-like chemotaxis protein
LVASIVHKEGYTVVAVEDGRAAYRILHRDSNFRAAIFDMMMPHLSGIDLIRHMRTEKRLMRIPVMMITSERRLKALTESVAVGATVLLPKPFTPAQLQSLLGVLLSTGVGNSQNSSQSDTRSWMSRQNSSALRNG